MDLKRLAEIINREFGPPFLKRGIVKAELTTMGLRLSIGPRDVHFSYELKILGAGTSLTEVLTLETRDAVMVDED